LKNKSIYSNLDLQVSDSEKGETKWPFHQNPQIQDEHANVVQLHNQHRHSIPHPVLLSSSPQDEQV